MLDHDVITPLVKSAARRALSNFPRQHEAEDAESAIWLWLYEHRPAVERSMNIEGWERALYRNMLHAANGHLRKEDAAQYGYDTDDIYVYKLEVIRELLWSVWDYDAWQSTPQPVECDADARHATSQSNHAGDRQAMLADVKDALIRLPEDEYTLLRLHYSEKMQDDEVARQLGMPYESAKKQRQRALETLRRELGMTPLSRLREAGRTAHRATRAEMMARLERDW